MSANPKTVCVPCRRVYKGEGRRVVTEDSRIRGRAWFPRRWMGTGAAKQWAPSRCPTCGQGTIQVAASWRPPRRTNERGWKMVAKGQLNTEAAKSAP